MVKPVKFAHVVYQTRRFDEMIAWYRNVFEAEVVMKIQRSPFSPMMTSTIGLHSLISKSLNRAVRRVTREARSASIT